MRSLARVGTKSICRRIKKPTGNSVITESLVCDCNESRSYHETARGRRVLFRSILKYKMDWNNRGNPLFVGLGSYSYRKESAPSILFSVREQSQAKEPNSKQAVECR